MDATITIRFLLLGFVIAFESYFYSIGFPEIDKNIKMIIFTVFNVLVIVPSIFE